MSGMRTSLAAAALAIALLIAGCSGETRFPLAGPAPQDPGPVVPPPPPGPDPDECGTLRSGSTSVNRSRPIRLLFTHSFANAVYGRMFLEVNNIESDTNLRFVAVREGDETTLIITQPGDPCGVIADTTASDSVLTRYAGQVNLSAGTWSFYADHASRVECWKGTDSGTVQIIDARFDWCE